MKKILMLIPIMLIYTISVYSQEGKDFEMVYQMPDTGKTADGGYIYIQKDMNMNIYVTENYLYLSSIYDYVRVDKQDDIKRYGKFYYTLDNNEIILSWPQYIEKVQDNFWMLSNDNFIIFKEGIDSTVFLDTLYRREVTKYSVGNLGDYIYAFSTSQILNVYDPGTGTTEPHINDIYLYKINANTRQYEDSIEINGVTDSIILKSYLGLQLSNSFIDNNDILWMGWGYNPPYKPSKEGKSYNNLIITYDTKQNFIKESFTIHDANQILNTNDKVNILSWSAFKQKHLTTFLVETETIMDVDTVRNFIILTHKNSKWDTISIADALALLNNSNVEPSLLHKWSEDELVLEFNPQDMQDNVEGSIDNRNLLIYNIDTENWQKFVLPASIFGKKLKLTGSAKDKFFYDVANWNGKHYFSTNAGVWVYNPDVSISDDIEASIIPDLWIRKLTPNPATSSVNVNIMYYPSGIYGNDLEVGLYNYMGEKVIDLTPLGTYTDHNHTWEATFDIPKRLAGGMYFLNVRSGDESRTKGIAIY